MTTQYHTVYRPSVMPPKQPARILTPKHTLAEDAVLCNAAMRRSPTSPQGGKSADRLAEERAATYAIIMAVLTQPLTANDICTKTGMGYDRVLNHLHKLLDAGKVTRTGNRPHVWGAA